MQWFRVNHSACSPLLRRFPAYRGTRTALSAAAAHAFARIFAPLLAFSTFTAAALGQALPSIPILIQQVAQHQQQLDKTREQYTYRELQVLRQLDSHGAEKKRESREYYVFFVNGHQIERLVQRDGRDLNSAEEQKEAAHIAGKVALAQKTPPGTPLNERHQVSIARLLTIEHFANERRVLLDNRPTIAMDFVGDRHADTRGIAEDASKHLSGTLWIDERDLEVREVQATLDSPLRIELGLVSLAQGSTFIFDQKLINGQVWLPTSAVIHVNARAALFFGYHIEVQVTDDQYKRFQASASPQPSSK